MKGQGEVEREGKKRLQRVAEGRKEGPKRVWVTNDTETFSLTRTTNGSPISKGLQENIKNHTYRPLH